jgi:hypothetical protein
MRCIIYDGHVGNAGYGLDYDPDTKKTIGAHRLAFKRAYGYLPKIVMHTCDTPTCVNPEHLVGGTQSDNIKDCVRKGRLVNNNKLTDTQALDILQDIRSAKVIAAEYGIHPTTVYNLRKGKFYKHVWEELIDAHSD